MSSNNEICISKSGDMIDAELSLHKHIAQWTGKPFMSSEDVSLDSITGHSISCRRYNNYFK